MKQYNGSERRGLCIVHDERLNRIDKALNGNGDPMSGIVWKVEMNTEFINQVKKVFWKGFWFSMVGCISAVGAFIIAVVKLWVRIQ